MPAILDRRSFLKTVSIGAAALATFPAGAARSEKPFRVALLSDTHIPANAADVFRGQNMVDNLKRITPEVVAMKPELVMIDGDAARLEGKVEDYQALSNLLQPINAVAPVCMNLGNHDDRANFNTVFKASAGEKQNVTGKNVLVLEHEHVRFIVLDSLMYTNKVAGQLGKAQREWLAKYLPTVKDKPVVLFVHHTLENEDGDLVDVDPLFAALSRNKHVKAIFYGHSHMWKITERQRVKLINLPAVAYPFNDQEPIGWVEASFHRKGVDLTMRAFAGKTADNGKTFNVKWA
ncbi:MAG TPA: metallophosphoesterase [Verrucomicrobiae bacterium]|nr:metallophosphoesterase [Verrucomicrobiae bacterium]